VTFNADHHSIIGVHGLGANPVHAWLWHKNKIPSDGDEKDRPKEDLNWLKDLLPTELNAVKVPCRVMVYNYDSAWLVKTREELIFNTSDRMLKELQINREKKDRPLIFIAHSFGGNLVEQVRRNLTSAILINAYIATGYRIC
jgi:hypothetical protein